MNTRCLFAIVILAGCSSETDAPQLRPAAAARKAEMEALPSEDQGIGKEAEKAFGNTTHRLDRD
jgi:hypothetical protein